MTCNNLCEGEKKENMKLASFQGGNELQEKNGLIGESSAKPQSWDLRKGSLNRAGHQA